MSKQHSAEVFNNLKPLEDSLALLGNQGMKYVSRLDNVQKQKDAKLECLNKLAIFCPSSPYSAIVLRGNKLYVAQNKKTPGVKSEKKVKEDLKEKIEFDDLLKLVPGGLEIEGVQYTSRGGHHADMEAISKAIESNKLTNEFEKNIDKQRKKPMYLGLARFNDKGENIPQDPASCASCFASIEALNKNGYDIKVMAATPYNFPSNYYSIPSLILDNPIVLMEYLNILKANTINLQTRLKNEKDSYVQTRVHADGYVDENQRRQKYAQLYDLIKEKKAPYEEKAYSNFVTNWKQQIEKVEDTLTQITTAEAKVADLAQKQKVAREKILKAIEKVEIYETLKNDVKVIDKEKASKDLKEINDYLKEYNKIITKADNANRIFKHAAPAQKNNAGKSLKSHQERLKELRENFSILPKRESDSDFEVEKKTLESENKFLKEKQLKLKADVRNLNEVVNKETLASAGASTIQELDTAIEALKNAKDCYEQGNYEEAITIIDNNKALNSNQIPISITATTTTSRANPNLNNNLTRTEKENLTHLVPQEELNENRKYNLNDRLTAVNDNQELLNKFDREAVITANINFKAIDAKKSMESGKTGFVKIRAEHNHLTDHGSNNQALIAEIQAGTIDKNTVIVIERKQYGENWGMKDIIKIANILEHNEKDPDNPLKLPEKLENTLIFQDALLYKAAKENGIKVISLEGRNLEHTQDSASYDKNREQYMTDVINEVRSKGYNVIANVGSSHVANLEKALENQQKHNTGFNHIPRKLKPESSKNNQKSSTGFSGIPEKVLQEALAIVHKIPAGVVSRKSVSESNISQRLSLTNTQLKKSSQSRG